MTSCTIDCGEERFFTGGSASAKLSTQHNDGNKYSEAHSCVSLLLDDDAVLSGEPLERPG